MLNLFKHRFNTQRSDWITAMWWLRPSPVLLPVRSPVELPALLHRGMSPSHLLCLASWQLWALDLANFVGRKCKPPYTEVVSVLEQPGQPNVFEPREGLSRAMPLPADDDFGLDDVTDDEWQAFYEAVSEYRAPDPAHKDGR